MSTIAYTNLLKTGAEHAAAAGMRIISNMEIELMVESLARFKCLDLIEERAGEFIACFDIEAARDLCVNLKIEMKLRGAL